MYYFFLYFFMLFPQVVYTDGPYIQVKVHLEVVDPLTGKHETTNTMHVTFNTKEDVPQVMPRSYAGKGT